jgi:hypothetical protein
MKKFFFVSILLLTAIMISIAGYSSGAKANQDTCYIYVYRVGQFSGAGANWAVFLDDQKICKLSNNKYMRLAVTPGMHRISAKVGGVGVLKKETEVEIDVQKGQSHYIACNVKSSVIRVRLEMIEVTKSSANKQMEKMTLDNCQEEIDEKQGQ